MIVKFDKNLDIPSLSTLELTLIYSAKSQELYQF